MDRGQIVRMLEIVNGIPNGAPRDKDSNPWSIIQKEFPCTFVVKNRTFEGKNSQNLP